MELDDRARDDVRRRLHRAEGQLRGVIAMLEAGRDCADMLTQLAAVTHALHRAGFVMIADGLQQCLAVSEADGERDEALARMEKLFLTLA